MATDLLPHIGNDEFHPSIFDKTCHSVSLGPVKATFCVSLDPLSVTVELSVDGHVIGNCVLSSLHPTCKIGGSIGPVKAELDLTLDIPGKKLEWKVTVCVPIIGCKTISGSLPV
jgi:hypothetical protein